MLVITNVECFEVARDDWYRVHVVRQTGLSALAGPDTPIQVTEASEVIEGERFITRRARPAVGAKAVGEVAHWLPDGAKEYISEDTVTIGVSKQARKALKTHFELVEGLQSQLANSHSRVFSCQTELALYTGATLWQRLKYLFTRRTPCS